MNWRLGNSIRLSLQTGLQLWKTSSDDKDIYRAWGNIKENIKTSPTESLGLHKLKQHKPWFHEECLGFLFLFKQAKMQWLQNPNQSNVDNLNNVRHQANRHFRN
jgi:hypothetical protein